MFLVAVGGCTVWAVSAARGPVDAANRFVAHLDNGEPAAAYVMLCPATRADIPFEEFESDMARGTEITDFNLTSVSVGSNRPALVTGTVDLDGVPRNVSFTMRRFDGRWLVCDYNRLN